DFMFATLIVSWRTETTGRGAFELDALKIAVKGKVEIETSLFAVGDDVEAGGGLVVDGGDDGVFLKFGAVSLAELIEVGAGEFEPARERVAADDGRSKRLRSHGKFSDIIAEVKEIGDKCQ